VPPPSPNPIILYDGVCGLCNRFVQFVLKHDANDRFRFAPLQSEFARRILEKHGVDSQRLESLCLLHHQGRTGEGLETRSTAVISVLREFGGRWRALANLLAVLPRGLRDWGYNLVARYRYPIFGKYETCPIPSPGDRRKFLDLP